MLMGTKDWEEQTHPLLDLHVNYPTCAHAALLALSTCAAQNVSRQIFLHVKLCTCCFFGLVNLCSNKRDLNLFQARRWFFFLQVTLSTLSLLTQFLWLRQPMQQKNPKKNKEDFNRFQVRRQIFLTRRTIHLSSLCFFGFVNFVQKKKKIAICFKYCT